MVEVEPLAIAHNDITRADDEKEEGAEGEAREVLPITHALSEQ